jgi:two-component sensor histidine kinase
MSVAKLQRQLAYTASGEVALGPYFSDLCTSIGASMILDHALMTITVEADDSTTSADSSVGMGLIVTELVINALKHAFPDVTAKGSITIRFNATAEGGCCRLPTME